MSSPAPEQQPAEQQAPAANGAGESASPAPPATSPAPQPAQPAQTQAPNAASAGTTSLYVGELDPTVTEAMLYEIFSLIGPVASIRVCRDAVTRRSLGYAYVNYLNGADGERALEQLNYSLIKNKPCRIMYSQRDPALRKTGAGNIFIKNLDETIDNKALHDTFVAFGPIVSCKVALDEQGRSKGYGFVHYETTQSADDAIAGVNGMLLNDKVVFVGHHIAKRERQAKIDEIRSKYTNLFIKNIANDTTEEEFKALFTPFGNVTSAVLQDQTVELDGKELKFGFVNYETHDDAKKALEELNDKEFKGEKLFVTRAQKKNEREDELRKAHEAQRYEATLKYQGVNLYVKNLEDEMDEEKLNAEFAPFGTITSCKIMRDEKGASKGFGFVCYSSPDEATKAVTELNGKMIGTKPLYVSLAQRKDIRRQQLEAQVAQRNQIRTQQLAASGIPGVPYGMPGAPMYYGQPGAFPGQQQQGRGNMMYQGQGGPGMMMQRPRYGPGAQMGGMPMPPYAQQMQQGQYPAGYAQGPNQMAGGPGRQNMPNRPQNANMGGPMGQPPRGPPNGVLPPRPNPPAARGPGNRAPAQQQSNALTAAGLASAPPEAQKQFLGEAIYPKIHATQPELAGKITGMLLEMDNSELLLLLEDDEALNNKVSEALVVLEEFSKAPSEKEA